MKILTFSIAAIASAGCIGIAQAVVPEAYLQAWNDPALVKRIGDGIERNRKGAVKLRVVDAAGRPLAGAARWTTVSCSSSTTRSGFPRAARARAISKISARWRAATAHAAEPRFPTGTP